MSDQHTALLEQLIAQMAALNASVDEFRREFGRPANLAKTLEALKSHDDKFAAKFGGPDLLDTRLTAIEETQRAHAQILLESSRRVDKTWATAGAIVAAVLTTLTVVGALIKIAMTR